MCGAHEHRDADGLVWTEVVLETVGTCHGSLHESAFSELAERLVASGFFALHGEYPARVTCGGRVVVSVDCGSAMKTVEAGDDVAPTVLRELASELDDLIEAVDWDNGLRPLH
jgi:hypothetical protein